MLLAASKVARLGAARRESELLKRRRIHLPAACRAPAARARLSRCPCRCPASFAPVSSLDTAAFPARLLVCPPQHFYSCVQEITICCFKSSMFKYLPGLCPEKFSISAGKFPRLGLQPVMGFLGSCNLRIGLKFFSTQFLGFKFCVFFSGLTAVKLHVYLVLILALKRT